MSTEKTTPPNKWGDRQQQHQDEIEMLKAICSDLIDQIADRPGPKRALRTAVRLLIPIASHRRGIVPWANREALVAKAVADFQEAIADVATRKAR